MSLRVLVQGAFSPLTGYGNDVLGITQALLNAGVDVFVQPTHVDAPLPQEICNLFTKMLKSPFDLRISHVDPAQLQATPEVGEAVDVVAGWTMWEFDSLQTMDVKHREKIYKNTVNFDTIINYDEVGRKALDPHLPDTVKTGVLQGGYWPERWPYQERNWIDPERFVFSMVGVLGPRKAPWDALQAFNELQEEFPEELKNVWLCLKTVSLAPMPPQIQEACKNVLVYNETWEEETLRAFYGASHCLLAPSRGEGKNMPALEMMSTGGAVLATDWGGHRGWLNDDYSYRIKCDVKPVSLARYGDACNWAVVDKEDLKAKMMYIVRNREEAAAKGKLASQIIPTTHAWDIVVDRFFDKLEEVIPEKGARLNAEYKATKRANS